jgi:hypothetical protein
MLCDGQINPISINILVSFLEKIDYIAWEEILEKL